MSEPNQAFDLQTFIIRIARPSLAEDMMIDFEDFVQCRGIVLKTRPHTSGLHCK
jgi:hypothetical protein